MVAPSGTTSPVPSTTSIICNSGTLSTGVKFASFVPSRGVLLDGFMHISVTHMGYFALAQVLRAYISGGKGPVPAGAVRRAWMKMTSVKVALGLVVSTT